MNFLDFRESPRAAKIAQTLNNRSLAPYRVFDWEVLERYGLAGPFTAMISPTYPDGFHDTGLEYLFKLDLPVYKPLLLEFYSTFKLYKIDESDKAFQTKPMIFFRLCNKYHSLSLIDFAVLLGLCENDGASRRTYVRHLREASAGPPPGFELATFWDEVGMEDYVASNCRESQLANPLVRLAHRHLTWTILFSGSPEKINVEQLQGLHYILNRENRWHLPLAMARMFEAALGEKQKFLPGGQFITQMAMRSGKFTDAYKELCGLPQMSISQGRTQLISFMILKKMPDGSYEVYGEGEKKEEEAGPSTRSKRIRSASTSQPQAPTYDIQYAINQNNLLGTYFNEVTSLTWQADARAHARYMTPLGQPLPTSYEQGWVFPQTWETRMETLNINDEEEE